MFKDWQPAGAADQFATQRWYRIRIRLGIGVGDVSRTVHRET